MQRDVTRPAWPAWYPLAALAIAVVATLVAGGVVLGAIGAIAGIDSGSSGFTLALTLVQDVAFVASALFFAQQVSPPRPEQFGLRRPGFLRGLKWAAIGFVIYFVVARLYVAIFNPHIEQSTLKDLGAGGSAAVTVLIGVIVVAVAPPVEEFLFRGFMYGAFRNRMGFWAAAALDGVIFGAVHAGTGPAAIPPLIALGFALCLMYEATGSIIPGICLHALNNMVAFGSDKDGSWAVGGAAVVVVLVACVTLPGRWRTLPSNA